jgi:hypothetical protein
VCSVFMFVRVPLGSERYDNMPENRLGVILIGDVGAVFCYFATEGGVEGV